MSLRFFSFAIFGVVLAGLAAFGQKGAITAEDVLKKTHAKLASLRSIGYKVRIEYNYASEGYLSEMNSDNYIDFVPEDSIIGIRYQFSSAEQFDVYNGSERFILKKAPKTIIIQPKPAVDNLKNVTLLQFSPLMIRNALPRVLSDNAISKSVSESTLNATPVYLVELTLNRAFIDSGNGEISPMSIDRKTIYKIAIDKKTFLPLQISRGNKVNVDFNRATYSSLVTDPKAPTDTSWFYSSFTDEYKPAETSKIVPIKAGEFAPDLDLPIFGTTKNASLAAEKGKIVLLNFWIYHCGYCQDSVPKLNAIFDKFRSSKNFSMLTVNVGDSEKLIQLFVKNLKPKFPILRNGEEAAKQYGVDGYPLSVLVGRDGKIIYSGRPAPATLERLIAEQIGK